MDRCALRATAELALHEETCGCNRAAEHVDSTGPWRKMAEAVVAALYPQPAGHCDHDFKTRCVSCHMDVGEWVDFEMSASDAL